MPRGVVRLVLDRAGIGAVAKSPEMQTVVRQTAQQVASNVAAQHLTAGEGEPITATVDTYTTDRAAASVTVDHPAGLAMQARHGVLTRAASAAGLEVTTKSS